MPWQLRDVEVGDGHHASDAEMTDEDPQLVEVGDHAASGVRGSSPLSFDPPMGVVS
jgi:hypothetical protein